MHAEALPLLTAPQSLAELDFAPLLELQRGLGLLGYRVRALDGQYGPRTRNAWAEFQLACGGVADGMVTPAEAALLCRQAALLAQPVEGDMASRAGCIAAITTACLRHGIGLPRQVAYVLATVEHETNRSFQPVQEAYYLGRSRAEAYCRSRRYYPYHGRGYVQLTWKANYQAYGALLQRDLLGRPDLAMEPEVALFVLVHGFKTGAFTGRRITDFIHATGCDYVAARGCINGRDRADDIAALAEAYEAALV